MTEFRREQAVEAFFIFALSLAFLSIFFGESFFTIFQARDLERVQRTLSGQLFLWGPETTGGGNLPGGFYYWLLGIPYALTGDWRGPWYFMAGLNAGAAAWVWLLLRRWGYQASSLGVLLFLGSSANILMFKSFWNPTCIPFFLFGVIYFTVAAYLREDRREPFWYLACAFFGFLLQLHLSTIPILIAFVILQTQALRLGWPPLPWKSWYKGLAITLGLLAPYFLWLLLFPWISIGQAPPESAGKIEDSLFGVLSNPANLMLAPNREGLFNRLPSAVAGILPEAAWYLLLLTVGWAFYRSVKWKLDSAQKILAVFAISTLASGCFYFFMPFGTRYAMTFSNATSLALASVCGPILSQAPPWLGGVLVLCLLVSTWLGTSFGLSYFADFSVLGFSIATVCAGVLAWRVWRSTAEKAASALIASIPLLIWLLPYEFNFGRATRGHFPVNSEVEEASRFIYELTGWPYSEARRRMYFLNIHREVDIEFLYQSATKGLPLPDRKGLPPEGFFLIKPVTPLQLSRPGALVLSRNPAGELAKAVEHEEIEFQSGRLFGELAVLPFTWKENSSRLISFHNLGYSVQPAPEDKILDQIEQTPHASRVSEGFLFAWNDCPGGSGYARTGALVNLKSGKLNVKVIGGALGIPSPWTFPYCAQGWESPFVTVICNGKAEHHIIAENIGLNWIEPPIAARTFLTPFEREFSSDCKKIDRIEVGRKSSKVNRNGRITVFESKTLSLLGDG